MAAIGLDVGTSTIIVAKEIGNEIKYFKVRDCFIDLESTPMVKNTLNTLKTSYVEDTERGRIYLIGENALALANMFGREVRRPMFKGVISNKDLDALPMMKEIFRFILDQAGAQPDDVIKYTIPSAPLNDNFDIEYHKAVIEKILALLGYKHFSPVNEGLCVNFAELEKDQYSGISQSWGAGMINTCVAQLGIPALTFSNVGSGDNVDEKVAKTQPKLTASKVTSIKESGIDVSAPKTTIEEAIAVYYKAIIKNCLAHTLGTITTMENITLKDNIPVVVAGGTSLVGGFKKLYQEILDEVAAQYNFTCSVRFAEDAQNTIAKGALVAAKLS